MEEMVPLSLFLAAVAAGCNALSSVLQRKVNKDATQPDFGIRLLAEILRRPLWLIALLAMTASFVLQAGALAIGTLSAVEPVLAIELPLTLIFGGLLLAHRVAAREWVAAAVLAAGLALFIAALDPRGGDPHKASSLLIVLAVGATFGGVCLITAVGQFGPLRWRPALFGVAAGSGFGLTASLIKLSMTRLQDGGVVGMLSAWETYGFMLTGVGSVILVQAALHAGTLVAAQPGITLLDPLVSLLWGTIVLGEHTRTGGAALALAIVGAALMVAPVFVLARSPAVG